MALSNPEGNTPGTWTWAHSATSVGEVGTHFFWADFTPNDATKYNTASAQVTVTVNAADPIAIAPTGLTAIYGQTLADVTLYNPEGNTPGAWTWADSAASVGEAGTHTFKANFSPDDSKNYSSKIGVDVTVTVSATAPAVTAPTGLTAIYGQTLADVTLSNPEGNTAGTWAWADSSASVGEAGTHTFKANFTPKDKKNYNSQNDVDVTVTVNKADPIAEAPEGLTAIYGDTLAAVTLSNPSGNTPGTWAWADSSASVGEAGTHTFKANFTPNDAKNYNGKTNVDVTVTVQPKAAAVTADAKSKTYGEKDPALTAAVTGVLGSDKIEYTLSREAGENVGEYAITVKLGSNPNYDVTVTGSKLTIGKKAATVTANLKRKTYGESDPTISATVSGAVRGDRINYTVTRAEGENVGEYAITVKLGSNPNYDVTATDSKLTIIKKAAAIVADEKSKTYGEADPALTAVVTGTVGSDKLDYTLTRAAGENAGEYGITVTLGENPNYKVTVTGSKLTIGKKAATVAAEAKSKTYGEADPELTAAVTGAVGSDKINYTLTRAAGENAGEYAITVTPGQNPNYDVTVTGSKLTIDKKAAAVTADAKSKTYGAADPKLTAVVTGAVDGDTIDYTLTRAAGNDAGEYAITVKLGQNPNYDVTATGSKLTIGKKAATIVAHDMSKNAGEADPRLTAGVKGTVGSDRIKYELDRELGEEAGTYAIYVTVKASDNPNYIITAVDAVFTVNAAEEEGVVIVTEEMLTAQEDGTVAVDLSGLEQEITEIVIPNAVLAKITEGLEIKLAKATIRFDAEAIAAIKEQVGDKDLHLELDGIEAEGVGAFIVDEAGVKTDVKLPESVAVAKD